MTLPRLLAIQMQWQRVPPLGQCVQALAVWAGAIHRPMDDGSRSTAQAANDADMGELVMMMGGVTEELPAWLQQGLTNQS